MISQSTVELNPSIELLRRRAARKVDEIADFRRIEASASAGLLPTEALNSISKTRPLLSWRAGLLHW